jgi:hypothetical protein
LFLVAKRVERVVTTTGATPLFDAWNACEKGSDRAMMMVVVKEADLMVVLSLKSKWVRQLFSPRTVIKPMIPPLM